MDSDKTSIVGTAVGIVFACAGAGCGDRTAPADGGTSDPGSDSGTVVEAGAPDVEEAARVLPGDLSINACPGTLSVPVPASSPSCDTTCGDAHCVPAGLLASDDSIPNCPDDGSGTAGKCLPDAVFSLGGRFRSMPCTSSILPGNAVCIPYCLAGSFKDVLKRDGCAAGEVCAPCTDPTTQRSTGACRDRCPRDAEGGVDASSDADADVTSDGGGDDGTPDDAG